MEVFDEYTGDVLPPALVAKAREEEVSMMEEWEVWGGGYGGRSVADHGKASPEGALGRLQ